MDTFLDFQTFRDEVLKILDSYASREKIKITIEHHMSGSYQTKWISYSSPDRFLKETTKIIEEKERSLKAKEELLEQERVSLKKYKDRVEKTWSHQ